MVSRIVSSGSGSIRTSLFGMPSAPGALRGLSLRIICLSSSKEAGGSGGELGGTDVFSTMVFWTVSICAAICAGTGSSFAKEHCASREVARHSAFSVSSNAGAPFGWVRGGIEAIMSDLKVLARRQ